MSHANNLFLLVPWPLQHHNRVQWVTLGNIGTLRLRMGQGWKRQKDSILPLHMAGNECVAGAFRSHVAKSANLVSTLGDRGPARSPLTSRRNR